MLIRSTQCPRAEQAAQPKLLLLSSFLGTALALALVPAMAQPSGPGAVEVSPAVARAVSQPLREMPVARPGIEMKRERPILAVPLAPGREQADPVVQLQAGPAVRTTLGLNFAGVGYGDYGFTPNAAPPDTNGAVGATQYVQWVNESLAVFDKSSGAIVKGPVAGNTLFANLGGACASNNDGDPIVQYDKAANRWVLTQFSVSTTPYLQCVAVSQTSDATGAYNLYAFSYGTTQFPDYPKLGVWGDAYYITYNIFNNGQTFGGAKLCAFDRAKMLAGAAATQQCFQLSTSYGGVLPVDLDGATAPPAGAPAPFINFGTNSLNLWRFHTDWTTPANSTLSGPLNVAVAAFTPACSGGTCIAQPGTSNQLDSLADRLMYRFAYRNGTTASAAETAVVNHSVKVSGNKRSQVAGVRWYQLGNLTSGSPTVLQQGTFAPDGNSRWMGSIAMDKAGNIALGYTVSSGSVYPSMAITGRAPTDAPGTMQAESVLLGGTGSQTGNLHRWGDYSAMTVDPVDNCTFYFTTEYLKASGSFNWSTRIASFKLPGCI
ncbi:MAG: hypothetical protein KGI90_01250 [Burkholderiales bacterium]|nr:hypothetical protein [Burkholderiales bacterium]MDE2277665.1 hypothetical protein [Burkholderiales bacterium]